MKLKTKKSILAIFLFLFFGFLNIYSDSFYVKHGYYPIINNLSYILLPVDFLILLLSEIAKKILLLSYTIIIGNVYLNIVSIITILLKLSYFYYLSHIVFKIILFSKKIKN